MNLQELFIPKLSKLKTKAYRSKRLDKIRQALKDEGFKGVEYKNKIYRAKEDIKREIANGIVRKYYKPNTKHKLVFQNHIKENNLLPLFHTSDNAHFQVPPSIQTDIQFTNYISKQNLFSTVFPEFKCFDRGKWEPCIFLKTNVGWITQDTQGYYRYCSKNVHTGVIFGFSLLDLLEIIYAGEFIGTPIGYQMARNRLATILNVSYQDYEFFAQQKVKYQNNLKIIQSASEWKYLYPHLYAMTRKQFYILDELQQFASHHITERKHAIQDNAVFFVSVRQIAKKIEENRAKSRNASTFAVAINLFATLGLLYKVPPEILKYKEDLLQIATNIQGNNAHYHLINFLTIPVYNEELLTKAEKKAKRLRKYKVTTAKKITWANLNRVFGEKTANSIVNVRKVSIMNMHPNTLQKMAEERLEEFPWEVLEMKGRFSEETWEDNPYCLWESSLFKMTADDLYKQAVQHFKTYDEDNDFFEEN